MAEVGTKGNSVIFSKISSSIVESILCQTELYFIQDQIKLQNIKLKAKDLNFMIYKPRLD